MTENSVVEQVHRAREELLAEFNGDLDALVKEMQRRTEESARAGRKVVSLPPRRPAGWSEAPKKAG